MAFRPSPPTSLPPSGAAGGDLTGTYPNPHVGNVSILTTKGDLLYEKSNGVADRLPLAASGLLGVQAATGLPVWTNTREHIREIAQGIMAQSYDRQISSGAVLLVDGTAYFMAIGLRAGDTVTSFTVCVDTGGTTMSLSKVGLYSKTGTLLASTADLATAWETSGTKTHNAQVAYPVPTDDGYYIGIVGKGNVLPKMYRSTNNALLTAALAVGFMGPYGTQTGQTDLPSPAIIAIGSGSPISFWCAVS